MDEARRSFRVLRSSTWAALVVVLWSAVSSASLILPAEPPPHRLATKKRREIVYAIARAFDTKQHVDEVSKRDPLNGQDLIRFFFTIEESILQGLDYKDLLQVAALLRKHDGYRIELSGYGPKDFALGMASARNQYVVSEALAHASDLSARTRMRFQLSKPLPQCRFRIGARSLDINDPAPSVDDLLEVLSLTDLGRELVERTRARIREGKLIIRASTEDEEQNRYVGPTSAFVAEFREDLTPQAVVLRGFGGLGIQASSLFHELTHSDDRILLEGFPVARARFAVLEKQMQRAFKAAAENLKKPLQLVQPWDLPKHVELELDMARAEATRFMSSLHLKGEVKAYHGEREFRRQLTLRVPCHAGAEQVLEQLSPFAPSPKNPGKTPEDRLLHVLSREAAYAFDARAMSEYRDLQDVIRPVTIFGRPVPLSKRR